MVLLALLDIACIVFCLALGFCLLGLVIGRWFRWSWIFRQGPGFSAVVGLAGCILFLEVWNFFFPVSHGSVLALACFTLGSVAIFRRTTLDVIRTWIRTSSAFVTVSLVLLLLTVSLFGLGPSEHGHYDTGLYYLNSIRWAHEYPVVPGLSAWPAILLEHGHLGVGANR